MAIQQQQIIQQKQPEFVEYKPFGSDDNIKLSIAIVQKYIAEPTRDGDIPDARQCMKFLMMCRSRRLNPFEGDAFMVGFRDTQTNTVKWQLITAHQSFLKRAETHPEFDGKKSGVIISPALACNPCEGTGRAPDGVCPICSGKGWSDEIEGDFLPEEINGQQVKLVGGWCKVFYKNRKNPEYQRLRLSTYNKNHGVWKSDPAGMICKCAEAAALRSAFPTTLGGLYLREEYHDLPSEVMANARKPEFSSPSATPQLENGHDAPQQAPASSNATILPLRQAKAPVAPEPQPEAPQGSPAPNPDAPEYNVVRAVRGLLSSDKLKEKDLLGFLTEINAVDSSVTSLEQIVLTNPDVMQMVHDQYPDIAARIKEAQGRPDDEN